MGLEAVWQKFALSGYQLWVWVKQEAGMHPFILIAAVIVIVSAFIMYKTEVRGK